MQITATEAKNRFGSICAIAKREPVFVEKAGQIDTVIITGTLTEVCCDSTARGAYMRDYKVMFDDDATGGLSEEAEQATFKAMSMFFGRVASTEATLAEMGVVTA